MKSFCAIISEFNPFHNGHRYLLEKARALSGADFIACVMSGDFTQRGDIAVLNKYARARHAISGGADCVLALPVSFSVAPAEIFARGAVKIFSAIPSVKTLAFGCESGNKDNFLNAAKILSDESPRFKDVFAASSAAGESYIKSLERAFEADGGEKGFISSPNNILGVEYAKSLKFNKNIDILPIKRIGAGYSDKALGANFSSAAAIRRNINDPLVKYNVPDFVYDDLKYAFKDENKFENALKLILTRTDEKTLKRIFGCGEGLENRLKAKEGEPFLKIIEECTGKRYPAARIKRILTANFLKLFSDECKSFLNSPLYLKPLAVKKEKKDEIFAYLSRSDYPLILSGSDATKLEGQAKLCKELDDFASRQWQAVTGENYTEKLLLI